MKILLSLILAAFYAACAGAVEDAGIGRVMLSFDKSGVAADQGPELQTGISCSGIGFDVEINGWLDERGGVLKISGRSSAQPAYSMVARGFKQASSDQDSIKFVSGDDVNRDVFLSIPREKLNAGGRFFSVFEIRDLDGSVAYRPVSCVAKIK